MVFEAVVVLALALVAYAYAGYPALAVLVARVAGRRPRATDATPSVTLVIAAHNEERDIAAKLENALAQDYPAGLLEIVVASDCSTDRTDQIVASYASLGVRLHRQTARLGKTAAQNGAAATATGEILVFSDATTMYAPDAIRQLVRPFADPAVGCVAGRLAYVDSFETAVGRGCRSYWDYEVLIKEAESALGGLVGVSGAIYAVRRSAHRPLVPEMIDDFAIASDLRLRGYRTVLASDAVAFEETNGRANDEFRMRVRVIEQSMRVLARYRAALNPARTGLFAVELLSHKVLRYAAPFLLLAASIASVPAAAGSTFFALLLAGQAAFYLAALAGWAGARAGLRLGPLAIPYYFALANTAVIVAFAKFVTGRSHVTWEPNRGHAAEAAVK